MGTPTVELDCRGMSCPLPVVKLANAMDDLAVGSVIRVLADDPAAGPDIAAWCRMRAQEYVGEEEADDGTPAYLVRRIT